MLQCHAIQKLHGDERFAALVVNLVDSADIRMIEGGSGLRLSLEATSCLRVLSHFVRQELQRDEAVQFHILGLIDDAHTAATELLDDAVVRNGLADHWQRILRRCHRQVNEGGGVGRYFKGIVVDKC
jgi:hypothetical protein